MGCGAPGVGGGGGNVTPTMVWMVWYIDNTIFLRGNGPGWIMDGMDFADLWAGMVLDGTGWGG